MYRLLKTLLFVIIFINVSQAQNFITKWDLPTGQNTLTFNCDRVGGAVAYTWQQLPFGTSGSGSFAVGSGAVSISGLPSGGNIRLSLVPTNLKRFYINNGVDKNALLEVQNWGNASWTNMAYAFYGCANLTIPATDIPNLSNTLTTHSMFRNCTSLASIPNLNSWNLSNIVSAVSMFNGASLFNQSVSSWNTSAISDMSLMFNSASAFDQSLGTWTLNATVNLSNMLNNSGISCTNYSATLQGWSANPSTPNSRILGASNLEYGAYAAAARTNLVSSKSWTISGDASGGCDNRFITKWQLPAGQTTLSFNCERVGGAVSYTWQQLPSGATGSGSFAAGNGAVSISGLPNGGTIRLSLSPTNLKRFYIDFGSDRNKLLDVENWGTANWTSMLNAFQGCSNLNITAADVPDLSLVSLCNSMFGGCSILTGPTNINSWNTSAVTNMSSMFAGASSFNQPIGAWNTNAVTNMSSMFGNASAFNQNIGAWNTGSVTYMNSMFAGANAFNQNIGAWNTGSVSNMRFMFSNANAFNQNISTWNTGAVTDMSGMFFNASVFNQSIGTWNTSAVADMSGMFQGANAFNQNIGIWNTSAVTYMSSMFAGTNAFNQNISAWNTSAVTSMSNMFNGASAFNLNIGTWTLNAAVNLSNMLNNCGMSCTNYSNTLIGWATNNPSVTNRTLGATGVNYGTDAVGARNQLTAVQGWTISGDAILNPLPSLVASGTSASGILDCSVYLNSLDLNKKIIGIDNNGNTFNPISIDVNNNDINLPIGFVNTNGYYQLNDATTTIRVSNQLVSIVAPGSYNTNGGVKVKVYYPINQINNMISDPAPVGSIVDYGWFKTENHTAQTTLDGITTTAPFISLSQEIFPISTGVENGKDYVEFLLDSFSTIGFFAKTNATVLPIELIQWNVVCLENQSQLHWSTATEINNDYYTIERSKDGQNWEAIETISGAGNSNSILNYTYLDAQIFEDIIYYRLKQTDYDGAITYFDKLSANCTKETFITEPKLFPNPNNGIFYIENNYPIEINIYSSLGELVFSQEMQNQGIQQLNMSHLLEGV